MNKIISLFLETSTLYFKIKLPKNRFYMSSDTYADAKTVNSFRHIVCSQNTPNLNYKLASSTDNGLVKFCFINESLNWSILNF